MALRQAAVESMQLPTEHWVRAAALADVTPGPCSVVHVEGRTLAIVRDNGRIFAVDNRCPHMGFPLDRGSVCDGILTCHWHHARFDLATGGTFDQWADDVQAYPVEVREGELWIDLAQRVDSRQHHLERLQVGLERNIPLVIGKAVLPLVASDPRAIEPFQIGLEFGTRYRRAGWGQGLTIHACLRNLLPWLDPDDQPRAVFHGLSAVANDCDGEPPRFSVRPLPAASAEPAILKRWFRQFIEVRDAEGAERCIASAVRAGADSRQMAGMLFAAATDHRYIDIGHPLDFTNKALEALDVAGWKYAEPALTSLASLYASAERMEESNEWRHPIDLVALVEAAFEDLPAVLEKGRGRQQEWRVPDSFVPCLLSEDPRAIVAGLLDALRNGCAAVELSGLVVYAAALRIAQFPTSNEFRDWDTALHSFTFANAVQQGLRRSESPDLLRGVFDAAMSVYLNRFLNVPAVPIPQADAVVTEPDELLRQLPALLDQRHQVNPAGQLVVDFLTGGGDPGRLMATLGRLLLREDRDFHTIQMLEAAFRQHQLLRGSPAGTHVLTAAARYLAAHSPTMRSQEQTWRIAYRLYHGQKTYETPDET
jgi:nitrite reductase/ring-hydroxylating ferredoxin subunit